MKYDMLISIDPGKKGTICSHRDDQDFALVQKVEYNVKGFQAQLIELTQGRKPVVYVEKVQLYAGDTSVPGKVFQLQKLFNHFSQITTTLINFGIQVVEVTPRVWQDMTVGAIAGETKQQRKARVRDYVREAIKSQKVVYKGYRGLNLENADAMCIMIYGYRACYLKSL
jgi:hypothetical protein